LYLEREESLNVRSDALPERGAPPEVGARQVVLHLGAHGFLLLREFLAPVMTPRNGEPDDTVMLRNVHRTPQELGGQGGGGSVTRPRREA
jgi:hypothetical protein